MANETKNASALSLIRTFGADAHKEAMTMAQKMAARGDQIGGKIWLSIADAIRHARNNDQAGD